MKVRLKDFHVNKDVEVSGIEFHVSDGGRHVGDLFVTKTGLIWFEGKTEGRTGRKIDWQELRKYCKEHP